MTIIDLTKVQAGLARIEDVLAREPEMADRARAYFSGALEGDTMNTIENLTMGEDPRPTFAVASSLVYTLEEAASRLKVSSATVAREIRRGKLKATKAGRAWRITAAALAEYLTPRPTIHELALSILGEWRAQGASREQCARSLAEGTTAADLSWADRALVREMMAILQAEEED